MISDCGPYPLNQRTRAAIAERPIETRIIDVIGAYTRTPGRSMRMSPGRRPNQDRAPVQMSRPIKAMARPPPVPTIPADGPSGMIQTSRIPGPSVVGLVHLAQRHVAPV